jgi:hypothetical protein
VYLDTHHRSLWLTLSLAIYDRSSDDKVQVIAMKESKLDGTEFSTTT